MDPIKGLAAKLFNDFPKT